MRAPSPGYGGYRPATPNSRYEISPPNNEGNLGDDIGAIGRLTVEVWRNRGQYSASVLEELESQNDAQVEGLSAKVKMLKDVRCEFCTVSLFYSVLTMSF